MWPVKHSVLPFYKYMKVCSPGLTFCTKAVYCDVGSSSKEYKTGTL